MIVLDFDKTIYDGDSSIDFYKYCLNKNKKCVLMIPGFIFYLFLYLIKIISKETLKSKYFSFVKYFKDINIEVRDFWKTNGYKIKEEFKTKLSKKTIIISASPKFLLEPIALKYKTQLIATDVDIKTGKLVDKNCYGSKKLSYLNGLGVHKCDEFYSDSLSDSPLAEISKKAFIVKKNEIIPWNEYHESLLKKIKRLFISPDFFTFCFIGIINVFNGVFIAYFYSMYIHDPIIAYALGFFTSLTIAYVLNSLLNFKRRLSIRRYLQFSIDNIPNFIIQIFSVFVLIKKLGYSKMISYCISAIVAVPITFILIKMHTFKKMKGE